MGFGCVCGLLSSRLSQCSCNILAPIIWLVIETYSMMGCNITNIGADGARFRMRLRPLLLQGMAGMRTWRLTSRPTLSKKALALYNPSSKKIDPKKSVAMATVIGNTYGLKVATKPKKARHIKPKKLILQDADHEDRDDDGRNIAAFPSSPSFRIFFGDAAIHNQIAKIEAAKETVSTCDLAPSEESRRVQKKVKKEGKKRNIGRVMSGKKAGLAVRNLLSVKSCYHPSTLPAPAPVPAPDTTNTL